MTDQINGLREGYLTDAEMAKARNLTRIAQRRQRWRGEGPPWVKDGGTVLYSVAAYREWLESNTRK
jgi:hypothetical protein